MRLHLGVVLLALGCAVRADPDPDAATTSVRTPIAPGEVLDVTRQTTLHDQEYAAPREQVWAALIAAEGDLSMPLRSADPAAGVIVYRVQASSPRIAGRHASAWLDCGRGPGGGPRVNTYTLTLQLTAVVEAIAANRTRVRTALVGTARERGLGGDPLPCNSTGYLERRALALLAAQLQG